MDLRAAEEVEQFGEPSILKGAEVVQHARESAGRWSQVVVCNHAQTQLFHYCSF